MPVPRPHPPAMPHGPLRELSWGSGHHATPERCSIHGVRGSIKLPISLPARVSRAMTILRLGARVVLVNSVRLDERGLAALDALGRVTDVIRLAALHGMDDPFYAERYGAKIWAVRGQRYTAGFDAASPTTYFTPHVEMDESTELPIPGARLVVIASSPPEGLLLLDQAQGVLVAGDCLQHWARPDEHFDWSGALLSRMGGFIRPYNVGPGWVGQCKPPRQDLLRLLDLEFEHVLPSHGEPVIGGARERYRPAIERVARSLR